MIEKWPAPSEQLAAVLAAPIPFFIVVAIIAFAAWRAWQWRFKAVFEKQKELHELSRLEVDYWKNNAERTTNELAETIGLLQEQQNLTAEAKKQLGLARESVLALTAQLNRLGQANSSAVGLSGFTGTVSGPVGGGMPIVGPTGPSATSPTAPMDWTSSRWRPRNPS